MKWHPISFPLKYLLNWNSLDLKKHFISIYLKMSESSQKKDEPIGKKSETTSFLFESTEKKFEFRLVLHIVGKQITKT
jgi:hypothetical protein